MSGLPPREKPDSTDSTQLNSERQLMSWPPPGLESVQGKLWPAIIVIAVGDVALIAPLLWSMATDYEFWKLGPFGNNWWIPVAMSGVGIAVVVAGWGRLLILLRAGARASKQGHQWIAFLQTVTDQNRDAGFLIQGARFYSHFSPLERRTLLLVRLVGVVGYLLAVLWAPLGLALSTMAAARGWIGPQSIWLSVLAPSLLLAIIGAIARTLAHLLSRPARSDREIRGAVEGDIHIQVVEWNERAGKVWSELGFGHGVRGRPKGLGWMAAGVMVLAGLVVVPLATLTLTGAIGTVITSIAVPNFSRSQARFAVSELLRPYSAPPDGSVTAEQAGEALLSLMWVGTEWDPTGVLHRPQRKYVERWFPVGDDTVAGSATVPRRNWALGLFGRVRDLSGTERAYLEKVASHPAHREFEILAAASGTDIIGTRYTLPLPDTLSPFALRIPEFAGMTQAVSAHVAQAVWELLRSRPRLAERKVREVIAAGFALIDDGPTVIDGLLGVRVVKTGGDALQQLYVVTGRAKDAEALQHVLAGIERVPKRAVLAKRAGADLEHELRTIQFAVTDESTARSIRWEYLAIFATLAPCVNLQKVVFGPGESYERWLVTAEQSLVRRPSDKAMFTFLERGLLGSSGGNTSPMWLRTLVGFTFGSGRGGTCAARITELSI
ncbi:MAG: hypothetical protein ACE5HT_06235 [Gemmatimonadales bacterium]